MTLSVGPRIGRFEVVGSLGAGGMGEVYRARDPQLQRDVAIKVLPAEFSTDAAYRRRFEQEARAAGSLNHPNILAVYDVGIEGASSYIVTELLEFGLAKFVNGDRSNITETITVDGVHRTPVIGSVAYMSPEQVRAARVD